MDIGNMMKAAGAWNTFKRNHPKFPAFCRAVSQRGIREDSVLETNLKVKASDLELLGQFMDLTQK